MKYFSSRKASSQESFILFIFLIMPILLFMPALSLAEAGASRPTPATIGGKNMFDNLKSRIHDLAKSDNLKWLCYYGGDRAVLGLPGYNLLVLEADALGPVSKKSNDGDIRVAYMSIGEISPDRWYWPRVKNKPWVLEKNHDWAGAARVDPRSREWSDMLVNTIAPKLLAMGYDGLMLDNVDIGEYLEQKDPKTYAGARTAVADIIRRLRGAYPHAALITNGGLETAAEAADSIDAAIRESVFSRWVANANGSISYEEVSPQGRAWLRPRLLRIQEAGLPLLDLEYVDPNDPQARKRVLREAKKAGFFPYLAQRNLMRLPAGPNASQEK